MPTAAVPLPPSIGLDMPTMFDIHPTKTRKGTFVWETDGTAIHCHRAPEEPSHRPAIVRLVVLSMVVAFLLTTALPLQPPSGPLSDPVTAQTYAPLTFPSPPYVEPVEARTEGTSDRASRTARAEQKVAPQPSKVEIMISFALAQQGKRYVFGSKGPNSFDCSGLVLRAFEQIGISLYHYTGEMMKRGVRVDRSNLQRGDIVFPSQQHVGIYLGAGQFVHASSGKGRVVVAQLSGFYTARRIA